MKTPEIIILVLLVIIAIKLFFPMKMSGYRLRPQELNIQGTGHEPSDFWKLPLDMSAVPGPSKEADYYVTDHPGGIVGGGHFVNQQIKNYKIV
jgi:hypothetical protein